MLPSDFITLGYFCRKCFSFIDGSLPGSARTCRNCNEINIKGGVADVKKTTKREKQPGRR